MATEVSVHGVTKTNEVGSLALFSSLVSNHGKTIQKYQAQTKKHDKIMVSLNLKLINSYSFFLYFSFTFIHTNIYLMKTLILHSFIELKASGRYLRPVQ